MALYIMASLAASDGSRFKVISLVVVELIKRYAKIMNFSLALRILIENIIDFSLYSVFFLPKRYY